MGILATLWAWNPTRVLSAGSLPFDALLPLLDDKRVALSAEFVHEPLRIDRPRRPPSVGRVSPVWSTSADSESQRDALYLAGDHRPCCIRRPSS